MTLPELIKALETAMEQATEGESEWTRLYKSERVMLTIGTTIVASDTSEADAQSIATRHNTAPLVLQWLKSRSLARIYDLEQQISEDRTEHEASVFALQEVADVASECAEILTRERDTANRLRDKADEEAIRFRAFYEDHQHEGTGAARVNELTRERDEARGEVAKRDESIDKLFARAAEYGMKANKLEGERDEALGRVKELEQGLEIIRDRFSSSIPECLLTPRLEAVFALLPDHPEDQNPW